MKLTTIGVGLDYYSTYGQLCLSRLLVVSQLVAGRVRWAFGGCCTAVVVSLGILPYIVHRMVGYNLPGGSTVTVGVGCELLIYEREGP